MYNQFSQNITNSWITGCNHCSFSLLLRDAIPPFELNRTSGQYYKYDSETQHIASLVYSAAQTFFEMFNNFTDANCTKGGYIEFG